MSYLIFMAVRLMEMHRVLKPTGSISMHCDDTASHYLKFVTTSDFTRTALEYVEKSSKRIVPINGCKLAALMVRHSIGARMLETYDVKRIDGNYVDGDAFGCSVRNRTLGPCGCELNCSACELNTRESQAEVIRA